MAGSALIEDALRSALAEGAPDEVISGLRDELGSARERERAEKLLEEQGVLGRAALGVGRGMANVVDKIGGLVGYKPSYRGQTLEEGGAADQALMDTTAGQVGNFAGEALATAPIGMGAGGLAGKVVGKGGATVLSKALAKAAPVFAEGAAPAALMAGPGQRGDAATFGAAVAGGVPVVGTVLKKAVAGPLRAAAGSAADKLVEMGVPLTPGMTSRLWGNVEDLASSFPFVGGPVRAAKEAAKEGVRQVALNEGDLVNQRTAGGVVDRLRQQASNLHDAYEQALAGKRMFPSVKPAAGGPWKPLRAGLEEAVNAVDGTTKAQRDTALEIVDNLMTRRKGIEAAMAPGRKGALPRVDAVEMQQVRSKLRERAAEYRGRDEGTIAEMLEEAAGRIEDAFKEQLPDVWEALSPVNKAYAAHIRVAQAAGGKAAAAKGGAFTPMELVGSAIQGHGKASVGKGAGHPALRELGEAAQDVFSKEGADTGQKLGTLAGLSGIPGIGTYLGGLALKNPSLATGGAASAAGGFGVGLPLAAAAGATLPGVRKWATGAFPWQRALDRVNVPSPLRAAATTTTLSASRARADALRRKKQRAAEEED